MEKPMTGQGIFAFATLFFTTAAIGVDTAPSNNMPPPPVAAAKGNGDNAQYDRTSFFGEPVYGEDGKLKFVLENKSQSHAMGDYVWIRIKNIKIRSAASEIGRIRVAVWDSSENYGKEGIKPFRAVSHLTKDAFNQEMLFKIGGLTKGKNYSFFAHNDADNTGKVTRNFLRIPTEQYIFSNAANQGKGPGLTREGFGPPQFKNTLVRYNSPGQEIVLSF